MYHREVLSIFGSRRLDCSDFEMHRNQPHSFADIDRLPRRVFGYEVCSWEIEGEEVVVVEETDNLEPSVSSKVSICWLYVGCTDAVPCACYTIWILQFK
jgi:hypothetical protein